MSPAAVALRKFPYPFRAALAVCSDIDGTDTLEKFLSIQEFLNTERETRLGPGLGLEIGNTFFPITPDDSFSYLSSRPEERETLAAFIKAGYVDCMHSYGSGARSRADVVRALDALENDGCRVLVWVDHARAPTNLDAGSMGGAGARPGSPVYHADLTLEWGIRFAWLGRNTAVVGQESPLTPVRLLHIYDGAHALESAKTLLKEANKLALARAGVARFAAHRGNRLLRAARLEDGRRVHEFLRCYSYWRSDALATDATLAYVLRRGALAELAALQGVAIVYTHLGLGRLSGTLPPATQAALHDLAAEHRAGRIYVTTTARLLTYCLAHRYLNWSHDLLADGGTKISIHTIDDPVFGARVPTPNELQGITFYVPRSDRASIAVGGTEVNGLVRNSDRETGSESVSVPRTPLVYPA